jgi:hypothetical protein
MKKLMMVAALVAGLMTTACASTFEVAELDSTTMRFAGAEQLAPTDIKVAKDFDIDKASQILFLRTNIDTEAQYTAYFKDSIDKFKYFDNVMRKDEFERYLIQKGLQDQIGDVSGFSSLSKAAGVMGDFLFADIALSAGAGYQVKAIFTVYNARDAQELYKVERQVTNWSGLDQPLFMPVLNGFFDWIAKNSEKK